MRTQKPALHDLDFILVASSSYVRISVMYKQSGQMSRLKVWVYPTYLVLLTLNCKKT